MNGMKAKKQRHDHAKRFTADGLPRDPRKYTVEDWRDVFETVEALRKRIAERHKCEQP